LTDIRPYLAEVDPGYRGHGVTRADVLIGGMRKGITLMLSKFLQRRSAIEAEIGTTKTDGRLTRCALKGTAGDAIFAALCACAYNIRKILAHLRAVLALFIAAILDIIWLHPTAQAKPDTVRADDSRRTTYPCFFCNYIYLKSIAKFWGKRV